MSACTQEDSIVSHGVGGVTRLIKEHGNHTYTYAIIGIIASICSGITQPIFFLYFGEMVNVVTGGDYDINLKEEGLRLLLSFLVIGSMLAIFNTLQYGCWGKFGAEISVRARMSYLHSLLRQDVGYYDERTSGVMNTELTSDCLSIAGMGTAIGLSLQHIIRFIGGFALAFYYSWRLSLVLSAAVPLFVVTGMIQGFFQKQGGAAGLRGRDEQDELDPKAVAGAFTNEVLLSIRSVQAMPSLLKFKLKEYDQKLADILPMEKRMGLGQGMGIGATNFAFLGVMYAVGMWYGGKLVDQGTIDSGDMFLCLFAIPFGAMSLGQVSMANGDIAKAREAANKLFVLQDREPRIRKPDVDTPIEPKFEGAIEFKNVSFSYPTARNKLILDELSFSIESGQTLAIVGPSGSGKSTVINLLERYYDPSGGEVLIDGEEIHNFSMEHLRRNIGYVSQLPLLFAESILENIRGGNSAISDDDVIAAAKMADAHDFISKLDGGYGTNVGEMGNRLSGGQKQRIVIARAIATNPAILLLDEATSALDTKSEREVQRAIDNIAANSSQTIVVIAHRLSTIKNADKILVLVDGAKEEEGDHQTLIDRNGLYAVLVREQQVTDTKRRDDGNVGASKAHEGDDGDGVAATADDTSVTINTLPSFWESVRTLSIRKDDDQKDLNKNDDENVLDLGASKGLAVEYANELRFVYFVANIFSVLNGCLWPVVYGILFPEMVEMLTKTWTVTSVSADSATSISTTNTAEYVLTFSTNFEEKATELVCCWVAIGVYAFVVQLGCSYLFSIYGARLSNAVRRDWFAAILSQDITYHDTEGSGKLNNNLNVETVSISDGMGLKFGFLLQNISQIVSGMTIAFWRSWMVALVVIAICPLLLLVGVTESLMDRRDGSNADPFLDSGTVSQEILMNIRTVLAFPDLIPLKMKKFENALAKGLPIAIRRACSSGFIMGIFYFVTQGALYGVLSYVGCLWLDDPKIDITVDEFWGAAAGIAMAGIGVGNVESLFSTKTFFRRELLVSALFVVISFSIQISTVMASFQTAKMAINKFHAVKEREPAVRKPTNGMDPVQSHSFLKGRISAKNVSFSYHSAPDVKVLDNVSFEVPAGSSLAIVGPSGSGKSTIISLIERFYDYQSGSIVMDGEHAINDYDLSYLRSSIGLVSQMPLLFDATVSENIRGGLTTATKEDIEAAAKSANAHDFIMKLDKGYDTTVGELGGKLSGGQRQRIAIARALLPKPSILLLDEATSALDSKSEKEVQSAIDQITASGQQTTITIAHRLSTIQNSDNILVLVDGKVEESGNHRQLMELQGVYSALVNAQSLVTERKELHRQQSLTRRRDADDGDVEVEIVYDEVEE